MVFQANAWWYHLRKTWDGKRASQKNLGPSIIFLNWAPPKKFGECFAFSIETQEAGKWVKSRLATNAEVTPYMPKLWGPLDWRMLYWNRNKSGFNRIIVSLSNRKALATDNITLLQIITLHPQWWYKVVCCDKGWSFLKLLFSSVSISFYIVFNFEKWCTHYFFIRFNNEGDA